MNTQRMLIVSGLLLGLLCGVLAPMPARAAGQSNDDYIIDRDVVNAGGGLSQSSAYSNIGSLGQTSPLGSSSNALHVVYAGFWHGKSFTLSIAKSGTGSGTVKDCVTIDNCPGTRINCGSDCSDFYAEGNSVLLQPFPDAGSTFVQWLVDGSPVTAPLYVTRDLTVTAVFESSGSNAPPFITSTPPSVTGRAYTYLIEATDPDNDPLTYSLLTAPNGMTIDSQTGLVEWQPTASQTGDHQVNVQVNDSNGGTDTQLCTLHVSANIFGTTTLKVFAGFDVETETAVCDSTALTLVPGTMDVTDAILLPAGNPLDFSPTTDFHIVYEQSANGALVLALEPGVTGVLLPDRAYESVTAGDIAGLSVWASGQHVSSRDTVIIRTADGNDFKIGNMRDNPPTWTVTLNYAQLQ